MFLSSPQRAPKMATGRLFQHMIGRATKKDKKDRLASSMGYLHEATDRHDFRVARHSDTQI
jgi:hypothetical protein